jgi:hypothetical protein
VSFASNIGKKWINPTIDQCEMVDVHHPDCTCASCKMSLDVQCLEPCVGETPECGGVRVCGACAVQMEREEFAVKYRPGTRFVIVHPEMGVYLGSAIGLGFWSKLDPVGQDSAVTFLDRGSADDHMANWDHGRPDGAVTWPVMIGGPGRTWASVAECTAAGLPAWDSGTHRIQFGEPMRWPNGAPYYDPIKRNVE